MPRRLARSASQRAKKVLPEPYSPRTALNVDRPAATPDQLFVDGALEPFHPDREQVQSRLRHGAAPQCVDDLAAAARC